MVAEFATPTRDHRILTKLTNEMRVSWIPLITEMSRHIKWLSRGKIVFYEKTNLLTCANSGQKSSLFFFSWTHKILTSVCFTMFRLEQPEIKISKNFQIETQYVYVHRYPNWYTKLKSCPLMYNRTEYRFILYVQGGQLGTLYMYSQCTLFRAVWVAFLVAKVCHYLNEFWYFIFWLS